MCAMPPTFAGVVARSASRQDMKSPPSAAINPSLFANIDLQNLFGNAYLTYYTFVKHEG
jgi:hypothetical protein